VSDLFVGSVLVNELLDAKGADKILDNLVFELDVADLDGRLLGDEIHLSFSFLKRVKQSKHLPLPEV